MTLNPFSFLIETKKYPSARLQRSYLGERVYDTWNVMAGRLDPASVAQRSKKPFPMKNTYHQIHYANIIGLSGEPIAQSLGIVDYVSMGLFPLLHMVLRVVNSHVEDHLFFNAYVEHISKNLRVTYSKTHILSVTYTALSWLSTILTGIINGIRLLIAAALTFLVCPFVLILHGGLALFKPRPFRLRHYSKYDIDDKVELSKCESIARIIARTMNRSGTIADFECELRQTEENSLVKLSLIEKAVSDEPTYTWMLDPNNEEEKRYLEMFQEYNVFGIQSALESEGFIVSVPIR